MLTNLGICIKISVLSNYNMKYFENIRPYRCNSNRICYNGCMKNIKDITFATLGGILFALSVNLFLIPATIYNGGILGVAQLLSDFVVQVMKINPPFELLGVINLLFNIPILIFAYTRMSKKFVMLTLLSIVAQTVTVSIVPIPQAPLVDDVFIAILLAAVIGSFGSSLTYKVKGSSGGVDIIGFYRSQKNKGSMGSVYLMINSVIYLICLVIYDVKTALYSIVYSFIFSFCLDKFHTHNIEVNVMIFTKNTDVKYQINNVLRRGVTHWDGKGAYTGNSMDVIVTIIAQSEVEDLRKLIKTIDPTAFVILNENLKVDGGFEKRLI